MMKNEQQANTALRSAKINAACVAAGVMLTGVGVLIPNFASTTDPSQLMRIFGTIAGSMAVGLIVYLICTALASRSVADKGRLEGKAWYAAGLLLAAGGSIAFLGLRFQTNVLERDMAMASIWLDLLLLGGGYVLLRVLALAVKGRKMAWLPVVALIASVACYSFCIYLPNQLNANFFTAYHQDAVTGTIYNVSYNTPYTLTTSGVYGHYSLFFWPILKLFGRGPVQINVAMAVFGAIAQLATGYCIIKATKNPILSTVAILASTYVPITLMEWVYWQSYPLRHLWPALIMAYCMYVLGDGRHFTAGRLVKAYALCVLGTVWNTDTGLISMIALSGCVVADALTEAPILSAKTLKAAVKAVVGCAAVMVGYVVILNAYNLAVGGPLILAECFFPLVNGSGFSNSLQTPLLAIGAAWAPPVVVFLISIVVGALSLRPFAISMSREGRSRGLMLFAAGLMGMGQCYYYFNRSVAGTKCIATFALVCLVLLADAAITARADKQQPVLWRGVRRGLGEFCFAELSVLAVMAMIAFPQATTRKMDNLEPPTDMATLYEMAETIQENFEKDTYIFGPYSQAVYCLLDWDPIYHMRDWPDVFGQEMWDAVWDQWREQDAIIILGDMSYPPDFDFAWAGDVGDMHYYVRGVAMPDHLSYDEGIQEEQVQQCADPTWGFEFDDGHLYTRRNSLFRVNQSAVTTRGFEATLLPVESLMEYYGIRQMDVTVRVNDKKVLTKEVTMENMHDPVVIRLSAEDVTRLLDGNSECPVIITCNVVDADEMFEDEENCEVYAEVLYLGAAGQE